jgi:glutamate/tyrosine decarboxylase-like PLP-dependent enzyme
MNVATVGNGSLIASHIAKCAKLSQLETGLETLRRLVAYCPEYSHSHGIKAFVLNDIEHLRTVPLLFNEAKQNFEMDVKELERLVQLDIQEGLIPFLCMACIGATSCCGDDDIPAISKVCKQAGMELLIDAAYAGSFICNPGFEYVREHANLADYFIINLSKIGYIGMDGCLLFHKRLEQHKQAFGITGDSFSSFELKYGDQMSHGLLKLYLTFKAVGVEALVSALEDSLKIARSMAELIRQDPRFELFPAPKYALVCFRAKFESEAKTEEYNRRLLTLLNEDERILLVASSLHGKYFLRLSFHSPMETRRLELVWEIIQRGFERLMQELEPQKPQLSQPKQVDV